MKNDDKVVDMLEKATMRAVWTACETMLGFITVGVPIFQIDWKMAASVTATAVIASILKSVVVGMPESVKDDE